MHDMQLGRLEEAISDCTLAIELDPDYIRAYQRRARLWALFIILCLSSPALPPSFSLFLTHSLCSLPLLSLSTQVIKPSSVSVIYPISYQDTDQHDAAVRDCEKVVQLDRTHENQATLKEAKRLEKLSKRKDYYKILGIERSASQEQIKQAYRKGALRHHPDRHVSAEPEVREKEENLFKDVSEAYSVLSDLKKKNRYDSGQDLDEFEMPGELHVRMTTKPGARVNFSNA